MVTDAVLDWVFGLFEWLVGLFPNNPMPGSGLSFSWIGDANYFFPVSEMFGLWFSLFALGGTFVGTSLVVWVLVGLIRGGSTKA